MKDKIVKLSCAYMAMDRVKEILRQLENLADDSIKSDINNLSEVVSCIHKLREETDQILISLVESQTKHEQEKSLF